MNKAIRHKIEQIRANKTKQERLDKYGGYSEDGKTYIIPKVVFGVIKVSKTDLQRAEHNHGLSTAKTECTSITNMILD